MSNTQTFIANSILITNSKIKGFNWVHASAGSGVPPMAVIAGHDIDGSPIYVGRCSHDGDLIPAKVMPTKNIAYVSHGGNEIPKQQYEVSQRFRLVSTCELSILSFIFFDKIHCCAASIAQ